MTRFARARGSKASNEKAPEDGTPWEVMKEQLLQAKKEADEAKNRQAAENQRIENYENFLKEQKVQKRKATWCDFPEALQVQNDEGSQAEGTKSKKKKRNKQKDNKTNGNVIGNGLPDGSVNESDVTLDKKSKNKKNKNKQDPPPAEHQSLNVEDDSQAQNQSKKKKKNKKESHVESAQTNQTENTYEIAQETQNKKQNHPQNHTKTPKKKKDKKLLNGQPVRRKEIDDKSFQLIINGKEVELVRYDGFPIMKKDAERLADLKNNMIKKGIPKSEVQRTMKLERRRAEKALARLRREVCYNCRKGGHNLSDCPELKSKIPGADAAEGVCFKCGSTEHRQFECKVQRDKEFRFATCFICKEPGHIARQCPDNPKGLYPNGGSCKLCGDVTHLRKDCPTANEQKEETSVKLQTLESSDNIEDIGQKVKTAVIETVKKPKKIKF